MRREEYFIHDESGRVVRRMPARDRNRCDDSPPCGGCTDCLVRQAEHYGMVVRRRDVRSGMPEWLYRWVTWRNRIPWWVYRLWPRTHWCLEFDDMLVTSGMDEMEVCRCFE